MCLCILKLSSVCACNKLLLIEAQTGQEDTEMKTGISKPNQWQMAKRQNGHGTDEAITAMWAYSRSRYHLAEK